ncbi:MAG: HIT family protein [Marinicaulis sp.]|nr:HIT family protein [Marinicaulis sp.]NNE41114.1 HIT family protein [Marinicaulis sp.]NNL88012.1 HIT family protein [Marinicaulis sp.]
MLNAAYDCENIFAKIIRGEMPAVKIYEDDKILSFMDVFPQSDGHALVIHKTAQAVNLLDVEQGALSELTTAVQNIAGAIKTGLNPDGFRVVQFNGAPAGQTVFHLHFHIIPIYEGKSLGRHGDGAPADTDALEAMAAKIRAAL